LDVAEVLREATSGVFAAPALRADCGTGGPDNGAGRRLIGGGAGVIRRTARSPAAAAVGPPDAVGEVPAGDPLRSPAALDRDVHGPNGPRRISGSAPAAGETLRRRTGSCGRTEATLAARGGSAVAGTDEAEAPAAAEATGAADADDPVEEPATEVSVDRRTVPVATAPAAAADIAPAVVLGTRDGSTDRRIAAISLASSPSTGSRGIRGRGGTAAGAELDAAPPPAGRIDVEGLNPDNSAVRMTDAAGPDARPAVISSGIASAARRRPPDIAGADDEYAAAAADEA
jgi:hypothetical protein